MAIFKDLEARFNEQITQLYGKYSTKDGSSDQPFLEWKPTDPNREETKYDSRTLPIGSTKRDISRLGSFLISDTGKQLLLTQQFLQLANTFAETRVLNPLFIIGNAVPYVHIRRELGPVASELSKPGDASNGSVGLAGRLQLETKNKAISNVLRNGTVGKSIITKVISASGLANIVGIADQYAVGILGTNTRPEFDVNGNLYSVQMWKGLSTTTSTTDRALSQLVDGGANINNIDVIANFAYNVATGKPNPQEPLNIFKQRYFITDDTGAVRYLVTPNNKTLSDVSAFIPRKAISIGTVAATKINTLESKIVSSAPAVLPKPSNSVPNANTALNIIQSTQDTTTTVQFSSPSSSTEYRYNNDARTKTIIDSLNKQSTTFSYPASSVRGVVGGLSADSLSKTGDNYAAAISNIPVRPSDVAGVNGQQNSRGQYPGYYLDTVNLVPIYTDTAKQTPNNLPTDFINFKIKDYVNNNILIFRAMLSNIQETVNPVWEERRYIGRTERIINYAGATRDLSFALHIHVFSPLELKNVWSKINYLTGLCFPAGQLGGYMVPPLIQLTIGDLYTDQPAFIRSLSPTIEDGTTWEIDPGSQVPMTIVVNIQVGIIEKKTMFANKSIFYNISDPADKNKADALNQRTAKSTPANNLTINDVTNTTDLTQASIIPNTGDFA